MKVEFTNSGPSLTDADLDAFEAQWGTRLPAEYRAFLKAHNGGDPEPSFYKGPGFSLFAMHFIRLLPGTEGGDRNGNWMTFKWPECPVLPAEFIPIGVDLGGDVVLMRIDDGHAGEVYHFSYEDWCDPVDPACFKLIAPSLAAFLGLLHEHREDERDAEMRRTGIAFPA